MFQHATIIADVFAEEGDTRPLVERLHDLQVLIDRTTFDPNPPMPEPDFICTTNGCFVKGER